MADRINLVARDAEARDLDALVALAGACVRASRPLKGYAHPGDVLWHEYGPRPAPPAPEDARVWLDGGAESTALAAHAFFDPPATVEFLLRPGLDPAPLVEAVIAWATERQVAHGGSGPLSTPVLATDVERRGTLRRLGFVPGRPAGTQFAYRLDAPLPAPLLPSGARLRHATDADVEARATLHRRAWSVWGPSSATAKNYRAMRAASGYDETLDVVLEWRGELLAYCLAWADVASGTAVFEPVGTHRDYAGHGFARAVLAEGLYRLRERGLHTVFVGTSAVNERALALYPTFGFAEVDALVTWERDGG